MRESFNMIDLERLKKLVRLANNNPNEHEANLAARKACKMIQDGNFEFTNKVPTNPPPSTPKQQSTNPNPNPNVYRSPYDNYYSGYSIFEEFFRNMKDNPRYKEYREGDWTPYEGAQSRHWATSDYEKTSTEELWLKSSDGQFYTNVRTGEKLPAKEFAKYARKNGYKEYNPNYTGHQDDEKYYRRRAERGFGNEVRRLKCKTCGNMFNTKFMGLPQMYECNECQWNFIREKG